MKTAKFCSIGLGMLSAGLMCLFISCQTQQTKLSQQEFYDSKGIVVGQSMNYEDEDTGANRMSYVHEESETKGVEKLAEVKDALPPVEPLAIPPITLPTSTKKKEEPPVSLASTKKTPKPTFGGKPSERTFIKKPKPLMKKAIDEFKQKEALKVALPPIPNETLPEPDKIKVEKTSKRKEILVTSNGIIQMINASGEDVKITGKSGVIIIKGNCHKLTVAGSKNKVTCGNVVTTSISGNDNIVATRSIGGGTISGNRNDVSWSTVSSGGEPQLNSTGNKNKTTRLR